MAKTALSMGRSLACSGAAVLKENTDFHPQVLFLVMDLYKQFCNT